jgi:cellulose synthase/poly-beta-1,6-N-acetylglucosamine synthase-like glycosyltransferase
MTQKTAAENPALVCPENFSVALGIPAYNEFGRIGLLLRQVLSQNDFHPEKIVVNTSGSTDDTLDEVIGVSKELLAGSFVEVINNSERTGKAGALDEILKVCDSDIVIFVDGDVKLSRGCFRELLKPFSDDSIGVVSGNVMSLNGDTDGFFGYVSFLERQLHHELCVDLVREGKPPKVNGTFFAVKRKVTDHIPKQTVSDDEYVSWNAQKKGFAVTYAPYAIVYTKDPENLADYISKRRRIFAGHMVVKKTIGYTVPTTKFSKVIPRLLKIMIKEKSKILYAIMMLHLQLASYILAVLDVTFGNVPYRYRVESAKF